MNEHTHTHHINKHTHTHTHNLHGNCVISPPPSLYLSLSLSLPPSFPRCIRQCAPKIPKENFTALTRLDCNRAQSQIAMKLSVKPSSVESVTIWGNHSSTQYPDVSFAKVN